MGRFKIKAAIGAAAAVALMAGSAAAQSTYCLYDAGGKCYAATAADCNDAWGWVFSGSSVTVGDDTFCEGGTYSKDLTTNRKNTDPPSGGADLLGCCFWQSSSVYSNIFSVPADAITDCKSGLNKYWAGVDCGDGEAPTGSPTWPEGATQLFGYCKWAEVGTPPAPNTEGVCYPVIDDEDGAAACGEDSEYNENVWWASTTELVTDSKGCPTIPPTHGSSLPVRNVAHRSHVVTPLLSVKGRTLTIASSAQDSRVRVRVINMKGRVVARHNVKTGNSITLSKKLSAGSYIIEARRVADGMVTSSRIRLD